jgi:hypothetical protein
MTTKIWFKDPQSFISFSRILEFIPLNGMSFEEKLNSFVRFSIYFSCTYYVITSDIRIFSLVLIVMLITMIYYKSVFENYLQYNDARNNTGNNTDQKNIKGLNCTSPIKENPFMNVLMNEYAENPERNEACDVEDENIKRSMSKKYYKDLYRDIDDVFDKKSSFRNFYTMPNTTIPNNQEDYAKWLYGLPDKTYKEGNGDRNKQFAKHY